VVKWLLFSSTELETRVITKLVVLVQFGTIKFVIVNCNKRKSYAETHFGSLEGNVRTEMYASAPVL